MYTLISKIQYSTIIKKSCSAEIAKLQLVSRGLRLLPGMLFHCVRDQQYV